MAFLGLASFVRHKAVINCRTRLVFFKVDQARVRSTLAVRFSEKFTRVPIHREATGALTVPCSIHGQSGAIARRYGRICYNLSRRFR